MITAMIAACYSGLFCAISIALTVIQSAEFLFSISFCAKSGPSAVDRVTNSYHFKLLYSGEYYKAKENSITNPCRFKPLFSEASYTDKENSVCNPYRFKNAPKLTAKTVSFISFIYPCHYESSLLRMWRNGATREDVFADTGMQKQTICL
jgi:hypothetical protein